MPGQIVALVPARNEAATIATTITSLHAQTRPPDVIAVVPNNCTDATADIARAHGAYVIDMGPNPDKKAGAINYGLTALDPYLPDDAAVFVMDADTHLSSDALAIAERHLAVGVGGVSCSFFGHPSRTLLGFLQRMEYHRYADTPRRHGGRAFVLSGTGTLFRMTALRQVRAARRVGRQLPTGDSYYDTHSLTEDNEISLALLAIGWRTLAPCGVINTTDVMETVTTLYHQRHRWYLGALRNIAQYGRRMPWWMRWTYWRQQAGLVLSTMVTATYLTLVTLAVIVQGTLTFSPWWLLPSLLLWAERTWTVWPMGWKARLVAALFIPEQAYTLLLTYIFARAAVTFVRGGKGTWAPT